MKSVVLLSAGLDSAVNLAQAVALTEVAAVITFDYGQKAAAREIERSRAMAQRYKLSHSVICVDFLNNSPSALTSSNPVPRLSENDLDTSTKTADAASSVWVPNRNGVFVNAGAAIAEQMGANLVIAGFNAEEAITFPDNSAEFVSASNLALSFSTNGTVTLKSYTLELVKSEIMSLGMQLKAPLDLVWSCYSGDDKMCGVCESCARFKRAAGQAGAEHLLEGRFAIDN
jgi:7-cyano-7-deazaguanine synthase